MIKCPHGPTDLIHPYAINTNQNYLLFKFENKFLSHVASDVACSRAFDSKS